MLNPAQRAAVTVDGPCLITACPGSGKTTVLVHRAAHLLKLYPGTTLVGVTFTSDAANELRKRIAQELPDAAGRVICGTFHSLCKAQIEKHGHRILLVDESEQDDLIRRAIEECSPPDHPIHFDAAKGFIANVKCQVDPILPSATMEPLVEVYETYQRLLVQMGARDFSDLLVDATRGMSSGMIEPLQCNFMLADEFQDTDEVQLAWLMSHVRQGVQTTVVGDDDQSIYGWRASLGLDAMMRFKQMANATHIALNVTYRCAREIVTPAARLITMNNGARVEKALDTVFRGKGQVAVKAFKDLEAEAQAVSMEIQRSGRPQEWAVLARGNAQLDAIDTIFGAEGVPFTRSGGRSIWEKRGPATFLSVCRSMAYGDLVGVDKLLRLMGVGEQRLGDMHKAYASRRPGALYRFLQDQSRVGGKDQVERLRLMLSQWMNMIRHREDATMLGGVAKFIENHARLYPKGRSLTEALRDTEQLKQCAATLGKLKGSLESRILTIQSSDDKKKPEAESEEEQYARGVSLMTMHASKGLEWPNVWIVGCRSGVVPSSKAISISEERRLFYVAMTRAKTNLVVSYALDERIAPSPFLYESGLL